MKTFLQSLLFAWLIIPPCFSQLQSPEAATTYWELFYSLDLTAASGGSGNFGVEFDGTYFYTTRWDSNLIHKYDTNGNLIEEFSIPYVWWIHDLAFDGTYMYCGQYPNQIYQMDFNTKTVVGVIQSPVNVLFIAYDNLFDAFWCGDAYDNPTLVSRTGAVLASFPTGLLAQCGAAFDNPYLYIFDQGQGPGSQQIISEWNTATGLPTGEFIDVTEDITGTAGVAGGLFSPEGLGYGPIAIGGVLVGDPDMLFIYSNHWYIPPYFEIFDDFIAGQPTACQNQLYWSTWNMIPCDSILDPFISTNQSFSPPNSVMIIENNDLVQLHQPLTYGIWIMEFKYYIPSGKTGQFALMSQFLWGDKIWGMECYFDQGGAGRLFKGDTVTFTWTENTWQTVRVLVDIEDDQAVMTLDTGTIASWHWSRGGAIPLKLDATEFRGGEFSEMYIDNYHFGDYIPVELTLFRADVMDGTVLLNWQTATETNNRGFEIQRSVRSAPYGEIGGRSPAEWKWIGFVAGSGTTTEPKSYSFKDADVADAVYKYRLKQIDYDGSFHYSDEVSVEVSLPPEFTLSQNYPNPFNPVTTIKYRIPYYGTVTLKVYDILGKEIATLVNGEKPSGSYSLKFDGSSLPSGVYIYKLTSGNYIAAKKFILLK